MSDYAEQVVVCPVTGEEHTVFGPPATRCPTREVVKEWVRECEAAQEGV